MVRQLLEDREHHVLLAHGGGVLDLQLLCERQQFGGGFFLELLKGHLFGKGHGLVPGYGGGRRTSCGAGGVNNEIMGRAPGTAQRGKVS